MQAGLFSKAAKSVEALERILASAGYGATETAWGLAEVVDENMANARVHAIENGEDLSEYTMIAFGGPPFHAARLCESWG